MFCYKGCYFGLFFFFKQKTAYEFSACLVGSEMCIRDRMRPGRFDRQVLVDKPDVKGREEVLKIHVRTVKLDPAVDLRKVAARTAGFAGADLANLVNEAALLAARREQRRFVHQ